MILSTILQPPEGKEQRGIRFLGKHGDKEGSNKTNFSLWGQHEWTRYV